MSAAFVEISLLFYILRTRFFLSTEWTLGETSKAPILILRAIFRGTNLNHAEFVYPDFANLQMEENYLNQENLFTFS